MLRVVVFRGQDASAIVDLAKAEGLECVYEYKSRRRYTQIQMPYARFMAFADLVAERFVAGELFVVDFRDEKPAWTNTIIFGHKSWDWIDWPVGHNEPTAPYCRI